MSSEVRDTARPPHGVDARSARSRRALVEAMLQSLREGAGQELTISAICHRAGVSRSTFYQHFTSLDALLSAAVASRLDSLVDRLAASTGSNIPALITAVLAEFDSGSTADTYRAKLGDMAVSGRLHGTLAVWIDERIRDGYPDVSQTQIEFASGGITRSLTRWLDNETTRGHGEEFADEIWCLVRSVLDSSVVSEPRSTACDASGS